MEEWEEGAMRSSGVWMFMLAALFAMPAQAEPYPSRPITVVVPYAAGGPTDTVARIISQAMGDELGVRLIVENVAGAGGTTGAARVAGAQPEGYSLLVNHIGMATAVGFYPNAPVDPRHSFEPIGEMADVPMTLVGRKDLPATNAAELIAYVKANKGKVTYAHAGPGTASHLCGLLLEAATGVSPTSVPYRGTGPAMTDLIGGQVDFMCDQTTNTTGAITSGSVRAYAITTKQRLSTLPDVPTMAEAGIPDFELSIWHGLYAPKLTPKPVLQRLNEALRKSLQTRMVQERFAQLGATPAGPEAATPEALAAKLNSEIARWTPVIAASRQK